MALEIIRSAAMAAVIAGLAATQAGAAGSKPDLSPKPPTGAIVLFDGKSKAGWVHQNKKPAEWPIVDGAFEVRTGTGDILTSEKFGDFRLHVEFMVPLEADKTGEARANSGLILQDLYEIQILDSYQVDPPKVVDCGAIYKETAPSVDACKAPNTWQSYDVWFKAPRFDADGKVVENPRVTVYLNKTRIHDNVEIHNATGARKGRPMTKTGPILLQDHHAPVRFRNIWIVPAGAGQAAK